MLGYVPLLHIALTCNSLNSLDTLVTFGLSPAGPPLGLLGRDEGGVSFTPPSVGYPRSSPWGQDSRRGGLPLGIFHHGGKVV
jgi:hypothetical protein